MREVLWNVADAQAGQRIVNERRWWNNRTMSATKNDNSKEERVRISVTIVVVA